MITKREHDNPPIALLIDIIIAKEPCKRHDVGLGVPCWFVPCATGPNPYFKAICNRRAKRAGYAHSINVNSLSIINRRNK